MLGILDSQSEKTGSVNCFYQKLKEKQQENFCKQDSTKNRRNCICYWKLTKFQTCFSNLFFPTLRKQFERFLRRSN